MAIKIRSKFIGTTSLGYVHNQIYDIFVWTQFGRQIKIQRSEGTGTCLYGSEWSFTANWSYKNILRKLKLAKLNEKSILEST